jgi:hypothetical protein
VSIIQMQTHIADIRSATPEIRDLALYGAEFRALQTSVLNAVAVKAKALTLPGGYVIHSQAWPDSDLGKDASSGISEFLANWAGIANPPMPQRH